ncbi:hypothetical protein ACFQ9X_05705 [Catenulispora yoronensis]
MEQSVQAGQPDFKGHKLRDVQNKVDDLLSRIGDDEDQKKIGHTAAHTLSDELQQVGDAIDSHG